MMKLFYVPGACSIVPQIVLREGGFEFALDRVDVRNGKKTDGGQEYLKVNPKGNVPALLGESGRLFTEAAVIIQYLADQKPETKLAPPNGSLERVELQEWLNFIATELHKGLAIFYQPTLGEELKAVMRARLEARFDVLAAQVQGKAWLLGETFTVADAYEFYALRAYQHVLKASLESRPALAAYYAKLAARPSVKASLEAEHLTV